MLNSVTNRRYKSSLTLTIYQTGALRSNGYAEVKKSYSHLQILKRLDVLCAKVRVIKLHLVCVVPLVTTLHCLDT